VWLGLAIYIGLTNQTFLHGCTKSIRVTLIRCSYNQNIFTWLRLHQFISLVRPFRLFRLLFGFFQPIWSEHLTIWLINLTSELNWRVIRGMDLLILNSLSDLTIWNQTIWTIWPSWSHNNRLYSLPSLLGVLSLRCLVSECWINTCLVVVVYL